MNLNFFYAVERFFQAVVLRGRRNDVGARIVQSRGNKLTHIVERVSRMRDFVLFYDRLALADDDDIYGSH